MKAQHRKAHVLLFVSAVVTKVATSVTLEHSSATTATFSRSRNSSSTRQYPRCGSSSSGALASVFRLRGADEPQHSPRPTTFLRQLRDRFTSASSSSGANSVVLDRPSSRNSGVVALLHTAARALKGRLMHRGAGVRGRGWLALVAVACILSVVRATASSAVGSRPWVWGRRISGRNLAVVVTDTDVAEGDEHERLSTTPAKSPMLSSWRERRASRKVRMGDNDGERRRRLLMTPRFPLAYMPWWKALQGRRKVCVLVS